MNKMIVPEDKYELGYAMSKAYWGKGIATEAAQATMRFGCPFDWLYGLPVP
jgi:RimJ/RimL family protein N-acetyltransferase